MSKTIKIAIAAVGLIGILAVLFVNMWLGAVVKTAIEQVGPPLTKTTVKLESVDISLLRGLVQLKGLEVGNPPGYKAPTAMKLGTARIRMDVLSVLSNTIVVDEILVEAPEITVEGLLSKNNLTAIQDNVLSAIPKGSPETSKPAEDKAAKPSASSGKKILIRSFTFRDGKVAARMDTGLLGEKDLSLGLPDIHLADIGKETGGATPEQAVSAVFSAITRGTTSAVTDSLKKVGEAGKEATSKITEGVKGLFK
jgi:uncharacterized protein involved in outer membrane biogenesis